MATSHFYRRGEGPLATRSHSASLRQTAATELEGTPMNVRRDGNITNRTAGRSSPAARILVAALVIVSAVIAGTL
jgi:hypothetical protein